MMSFISKNMATFGKRQNVIMPILTLRSSMPALFFYCCFSLWIFAADSLANDAADGSQSSSTFYLVRHAEKVLNAGKDPLLTEQGEFRAKFYSQMFKDIPLDNIYSTDTIRTIETARPTAENQGLKINLYDARGIDYQQFLQENKGKTVLVVGHSNTIPVFVNGLLGREKYTELNEAEYDSVFVVNVSEQNKSDSVLSIAARLNKTPPSEESGLAQHEKIDYLEYAAKDIDATKAFFEQAFGWSFVDYGPDYTAFENQGVNGGFYRADKHSSAEKGAALTVFYSASLEDTQSKVIASGGKISTAIFEFPGGRRFHFIEPSGNEFAVWGE